MKVAVVGATGMVGEVMLKVLAERNFPVTELIPVASERFMGYFLNEYLITTVQQARARLLLPTYP